MNYYIQGDAAKAEEIKAAFEELGYDTKHYTFDNDNLLFYTINGDYIPFLDGRIMREAILINIIKTHPDYKELELPKPHYDIANFQPFDKVLTRDTESGHWNVNLFSYYIDDKDARVVMRFRCMNSLWGQCIPFNDDTKHLLGTTDQCDEQYINW